MKRIATSTRTVLAALGLTLLLTACAGSDTAPEEGDSTTVAPVQPTDASATELKQAIEVFNAKDYTSALMLFKAMAINPQHPHFSSANKALGVMYTRGLGVEADPATGSQYILSSAYSGDAESQAEMARRYDFGTGVERDTSQIVHWANLAAQQGNPQGQQYMGWAHHFGIGVEKDLDAAVGYYEAAAAGGNPIAQNNLAVLYQKGEGVPRDMHRAVTLFRSSAEQNFAAAQIQLGLMYLRGEDIPGDRSQAREWLGRAADRGHILGSFFLAQVLEEDGDLNGAQNYYQHAANGGIKQAAEALERLQNAMQ